MATKGRKLLRFLPPALALAGLCAACAYGVRQIENRMQGYGDRRVVINEICAHNLSGLQDGNGAYGDWIELFNPGSEPVDLSGWTLSDDEDDPGRWTFPEGTVLEDYLIVFADRANTTDPAGYCHTSFALRTDGETLYLYDAAGERVDKLKYPEQDFDITYGRAFGSGEDAGTFATATPGAANPVDFLAEEREAPLGTAEFSLPAGFYEEPVEVALRTEDPETLIFYTTDGSDPRENGRLYTGPIRIESRAGEPNEYVSIPNRFGYGSSEFLKSYAYDYAPDPVDKATTVTACIYKDGSWSEEVSAATYWVGVEPHTLPVVSVTADEQELFGPEGIYTPGTTYYTMLQQGIEGQYANFLSEEKIDAAVQLVDGTTSVYAPAEISVAGQGTRLWFAMKNLSVDWQQNDGTEDWEQMLNQEGLQGLSLKATGNGGWRHFYIDGFWNNYLYDEGIGAQYNVPVVLYLEDEYWGLYCARNRKDEDFIANQYDVDADTVVICTSTKPDADNSLATLFRAVQELPDGDEGWTWIEEHFDIESFVSYVIPHLYTNNFDGMRVPNNIILWKAAEGDSAYADGRWRFLMNDFDMTIVYDFMDPIGDLLYNEADPNNLPMLLFQKLWQYADFRDMLAAELRQALATTYAPENLIPAFEDWCDRLRPEMERNIARQKVETTWLAPLADWLTRTESESELERYQEPYLENLDEWEEDRIQIENFFTVRVAYLTDYLETHLADSKE